MKRAAGENFFGLNCIFFRAPEVYVFYLQILSSERLCLYNLSQAAIFYKDIHVSLTLMRKIHRRKWKKSHHTSYIIIKIPDYFGVLALKKSNYFILATVLKCNQISKGGGGGNAPPLYLKL